MKHLDAGESDGCALIQVVVLPMQATAPSQPAWLATPNSMVRDVSSFKSKLLFHFAPERVKGCPVVHEG